MVFVVNVLSHNTSVIPDKVASLLCCIHGVRMRDAIPIRNKVLDTSLEHVVLHMLENLLMVAINEAFKEVSRAFTTP